MTAKQQSAEPQMCAEHFPGGWPQIPSELVTVACEHGRWVREDPPAADSPTVGTADATGR
jgi:hypothetical protein